MLDPMPSVPTPLLAVQLGTQPRRAVPLAVLCSRVAGEPRLGPGGQSLAETWRSLVVATGKAGEVHPLPGADGRLRWLAGVGEGSEVRWPDAGNWRAAGAALLRAVNARAAAVREAGGRPARQLQVELPGNAGPGRVTGFVLGAILGGYRFQVSAQRPEPATTTLHLITEDPTALAEAVRRARVLAAATALARDLANAPSNIKDPRWLAATAAKVTGGVGGLSATVRDEHWLAERGFGGVLAVGGGSSRPPRLIELRYRPAGSAAAPHLALVGKGITFDTGGLSLKPNAGMHLMRTDMAGGASVIAALRGIAELGLPLRVTGLIPAAENHVSGSAYRPGDVVRHYGGKTTEVANTDAEGRMVLADALAYAVRQLRPDCMVDVATLTGAMKVALGLRTGGLFASQDQLAELVAESGAAVGETFWRMPLVEEHASEVRGELADVRQAPPGPGGITAALFLREFTEGLPWAHLDIAGPARAEAGYDEVMPGATGFAARTLVELATRLAAQGNGR
ncbi:MAG: leucyl aminopeptidase [Sciscionella sp.]